MRRERQMTKEIIYTDKAPKSLAGYSQAVKAGGFIFVAGQGPFDPITSDVIGGTIQEQTAQCLRNIKAILVAANSSLEKVVSATFILDEESDYAGMNEEWGKWFPKDAPARQGSKLPIHPKGMKISIAVIAEA
jgi:2-iminobutanoate/2-iminopropanoate deaminase